MSLKDVDLPIVTLCRSYAAFTRSRLTSSKDKASYSWLILIWLLVFMYLGRFFG